MPPTRCARVVCVCAFVVRAFVRTNRTACAAQLFSTAKSQRGSKKRESRHVVEAVVSRSSPFIGIPVRQTRFREVYQAAIVAIHRAGERVTTRIADVVLQPGEAG